MFARWQRSERALLVACAEMYFQGVSTRRVQQVLDEMCGCDVSAMTVSRVAAELDEKLAEFRGRRLDQHEYPYRMIDARYEKVRRQGGIVSEAVLVVSGFNEQGQREISDWRNGASESEAAWGELFRQLKERGLSRGAAGRRRRPCGYRGRAGSVAGCISNGRWRARWPTGSTARCGAS